MGLVDRCRGGTPVHGGEPAGVAMGQYVDGRAGCLGGGNLLDEGEAAAADRFVVGDVLPADRGGPRVGGGDALAARPVAHRGHDLVEAPFQVDRRRPRGDEHRIGLLQRSVGGVGAQCEAQPIGGDGPDHRRAAGLHG
jgi:hypothetical protein